MYRLFLILLVYYLLISVVAFIAYGVDKYKAKRKLYRIPEKVLISFMALGGVYGALLGMTAFRHKIRKIKFIVCGIVFFIIHTGLLLFIGLGNMPPV